MQKLILFLSLGVILCSCTKEEPLDCEPDPSELIIKSGEVCGWCAKNDTLVVTAQQAGLKAYKNCTELDSTASKALSSSQWNDLKGKLNIHDFTSLSLNACAVCYDGCDKWISIQNDTLFHQIRYESGDTAAVQNIQNFVRALDSLSSSLIN